ncbi:phage holin, LLH family [Ktedonospora formicarum]|uniref:Uncharacterized protein n=1 Tax=Ktedonospora formicarum TaxID=2778364 RepID=A0A8J3HYC0_9CHLR|nr:phage holin, LLH family [Ktedonospora formicarum]GHO43365.1 hypothetical protein KSX_15280 [Ktedonospora formicarum]
MTRADLMQLLPTIVTIVLPLLISLSGVLYKNLVQHLPEQRRTLVEQVVRTVVTAIEQATNSAMENADKKQAAILLVQRTLRDLGLKVSPDTIAIMIEAAVYAMKQDKMAPQNTTNTSTPYAPTPYYPTYYYPTPMPTYQPIYTHA